VVVHIRMFMVEVLERKIILWGQRVVGFESAAAQKSSSAQN